MPSENPFRQPLRRRNVHFKTVVRHADGRGKDAGGNTDFAIGSDYLWIAFDFSVPLEWITQVEPRGPGFLVTWENPIERSEESAAFCILRTGFGYNTKRRDDLVRRVREAVANATTAPLVREVSIAQTMPSCENCGELRPKVFDFTWFTSFLTYSIAKPDRRVLCRTHGASRLRAVITYNLILGNLGFGVFVSPVINLRNIRAGRQSGAIEPSEAGIWTILVFWPYALLVTMVGSSIWSVVKYLKN